MAKYLKVQLYELDWVPTIGLAPVCMGSEMGIGSPMCKSITTGMSKVIKEE